jgi:hypothetical protein
VNGVLPLAPASVADEAGAPRFGTYQGTLNAVELERLSDAHRPLRPLRPLRHKRWVYSFVATREVIAVQAMVALNYTSNAFALVADLTEKKVLIDEGYLGLPGPLASVSSQPGAGLSAHFILPTADLRARRPMGDDRYHLSARLGPPLPLLKPRLELDASLLAAGAPPPLTVIAPVDGGPVNVTQKWAGLLAFGHLQAKGKRFVLDGGVGGFDYTHGYLARRTAWRWGFACGRLDDGSPVGVNLVEGFNEGRDDISENAVWLNGQLFPVGRARFAWNPADPLDAWDVTTVDGAVKLRLLPIGAHREERDLKLVKSHFVQPVGLFRGELKVGGQTYVLDDVPGVTEDQDILW